MKTTLLNKISQLTNEDFVYLDDIYADYSQHPELSLQEFQTSKKQYQYYKDAGCDIVEFCAGTGVVAVIKNGEGKTCLFRNDHDALALDDQITVERYRSTVPGVAHKCGHACVPAISVGLARNLVRLKDHWQGTVVLVSQLGEEGFDGARLMLKDGLYERFPKPDMAIAYHCAPFLPVGQYGFRRGFAFATTEIGTIVVKGHGGHGGVPDEAIDPIVLASAIVMRLQTIVSREISSMEPAVLSVCSIASNTQYPTIIPDEVTLKFTIRCFGNDVFYKIQAAIERICQAEAMASGLAPEEYPQITYRGILTEAVYNNPKLTEQLENIYAECFSPTSVKEAPCFTFGEDFSAFSLQGEIPACLIWLGSVSPDKFDAEGRALTYLEPLHSPKYMPEPETIKAGVAGISAAIVALLKKQEP